MFDNAWKALNVKRIIALYKERVSKILIAAIAVSLFQTISFPILLPETTTPKAEAVTNTYGPATATDWTVPANVTTIQVTIKGGSGGRGGLDCGSGCTQKDGGPRGSFTYTFNVAPGDSIGIYPGNKGGDGVGGTGSGGGTAGSDTSINGGFDGGTGGNAGATGSSGGGGGGGAASVLTINGALRAVAGGAGGGGGAANVANSGLAGTDYSASSLNGTSFTGGNGGTTAACTTTASTTTNDGGGSGGSGGGYYGGSSQSVYAANAAECAGRGGVRGGNYLKENSGTEHVGNSGLAQGSETVANTNGSIEITYTPNASYSACSVTTTTVDIYTVQTIISTNSCTWTTPANVTAIDFFVVGGGGGGGADGGGGGGGGGAISRTAVAVTPSSSLTLTVGAGGSGGTYLVSRPVTGLASTIVVGSATFTANGGSAGTQGPSNTNAAGGSTTNGSTAIGLTGGAGGAGAPTLGSSGTNGSVGVTNYYLGVQNTYAGGGGGGMYPNSTAAWTARSGNSGGGNGASASGGVNTAGSDGVANSGGGGGGGAANYNRTTGGHGADGVILIRFATDASNSFPSSLSGNLVNRYLPGDLQVSGRKDWIDSAGQNTPIGTASFRGTPSITTQGTTDSAVTVKSSKSLLTAAGSTSDGVTLGNLPSSYTLFHVARYQRGGSTGRIIGASGVNWLSGFYNGLQGVAHHQSWATPQSPATDYSWQLSTDQTSLYRSNGLDVTFDNYAGNATTTGFGINVGWASAEYSTWQVADLLVFNRQLNNGEIRAVENYLSRVYGLTLDSNAVSSETDTAVLLNGGNDYFYTHYLNQSNILNDTFTVSGWISPTSTCNATSCAIFSRENALVTRIYAGTFWYALYGTNVGWEWTDTGVQFPFNEWHHFTLTKRAIANTNNSVDLYRDGVLVYTKKGNPYLAANTDATYNSANVVYPESAQWTYIGARSGNDRFYGQLDEIKVWKVARTSAQIASDMTSSDASDSNLQMYYDFNRNSLSSASNIPNIANGGPSRSDLVAAGGSTKTFRDIKTVSTSASHVVISFPRTYINQFGGWKSPSGISNVQVAVIGGGGGGGGGYQGGGGGAGGFIETQTSVSAGTFYSISVGAGGRGAIASITSSAGATTAIKATSGNNSQAFSLTAIGGGSGGSEFAISGTNSQFAAESGGSGGGGNWGDYASGGTRTVGQGNIGGTGGGISSTTFYGGGGGGAGSAGANFAANKPGDGGTGLFSGVVGSFVAAGGGGSMRSGSTSSNQGVGGSAIGGSSGFGSTAPTWGTAATGSGGGAGRSDGTGGSTSGGSGAPGGSGVVAIRYLNTSTITFTSPSNRSTTVGVYETLTVTGSPVGTLARSYQWQSSTDTGTTWSNITGGTSASYSLLISDTSTSGSRYRYRALVTDFDTITVSGLSVTGHTLTDSTTAVFLTISPPPTISGNVAIATTLGRSYSETLTVTNGTSPFTYALTPTISGITVDTSTARSPVIKLANSLNTGTYSETLTATDSATATVSQALTITVNPNPTISPPTSNTSGLVVHLDATNETSYSGTGTTWNDLSGNSRNAALSGVSVSGVYGFAPGNATCTTPTFSSSNGGYFSFNGTNDCAWISSFPNLDTYTVEMWVNPTLGVTQATNVALISTPWNSGDKINFTIFFNGAGGISGGIFDGSNWTTTSATSITAGSWSHVALVSSARVLTLYVNGESKATIAISSQPSGAGKGVFIGRRWDAANNFRGLISQVRILSSGLTATEIRQNFYQTSGRYSTSAIGIHTFTKTYGATVTQIYTASNGTGTKQFSFTPNNRSGISWDTSTANSATLTLSSNLNVGTYYETMTVTDSVSATSSVGLTITVNKARQASLSIGQYNAFVGVSSFPVNVYGGSGTGAVTRSLTNAGTAGCSLSSGMFLSALQVGSCTVQAVKAGDTNYLAETATATIYWIQWSDAYATRVASTPNEIVLNHQTAITKYNFDTLTVTSYTDTATVPNTITSARVGQTIRIVGTGFSSTAAYTEVNFTNMEDMPTPLQIESTFIRLVIPPGSQTGQVIVNMPGKSPAYGPVLTITP